MRAWKASTGQGQKSVAVSGTIEHREPVAAEHHRQHRQRRARVDQRSGTFQSRSRHRKTAEFTGRKKYSGQNTQVATRAHSKRPA